MNPNMLLAMPSTPEMLIVLAIVLVIFGGSKIPKLMGGFGKGIKEFKKGVAEDDSDKETKLEIAESDNKKQLKEKIES
jgi:sec-independent protein translocase protein TatA